MGKHGGSSRFHRKAVQPRDEAFCSPPGTVGPKYTVDIANHPIALMLEARVSYIAGRWELSRK